MTEHWEDGYEKAMKGGRKYNPLDTFSFEYWEWEEGYAEASRLAASWKGRIRTMSKDVAFQIHVNKIWNAMTLAAAAGHGLALTADDVKILIAEFRRLDNEIEDLRETKDVQG